VTPDERLQEIRLELAARNPENKIDPTLDRIRAAAEILGDPQLVYPVIHIAGTNGKTTTSRMIETLLREFGLTTGLMTSPHLHDERERIRLNGEPVDVQRFIEAYEEIEPYLGLVDDRIGRLSYFEVLTLLGFAIFADAPVGVAVIEVGLGGELDASNIVEPVVTVITPIGMDHQEYLGNELAGIAQAKAGILKPGAVPVLSRQSLECAEVIANRCAELGIPMLREGVEFGVVDRQIAVGGQLLTLHGIGGDYTDIMLPLHGEHQASNAAVALTAVEAFFGATRQLDPDVVRSGFLNVTSPGRCEVVRRSPTVIVDAAHNPHGAQALATTLADSFDFRRLVGVIAVLAEKDAHGVLEALEPVLDEVVITRNTSPRALEVDALRRIAVEVFGDGRVHVAASLPAAAELATSLVDTYLGEGGLGIVITGSVVTAAEGRALYGKTSV
jgi:dihydrofolate synthase/folylpolyglutamate synthase